MKLFGIILFVCPLMAQVECVGIPSSDPVPSGLIPPSSLASSNSTDTVLSTMRPAAIAGYLATPSKEGDGKTFYRWSLAAVAAGNAADTFSSWHHPEATVFLSNPGTNFDARSVALKSAQQFQAVSAICVAQLHDRRCARRRRLAQYVAALKDFSKEARGKS